MSFKTKILVNILTDSVAVYHEVYLVSKGMLREARIGKKNDRDTLSFLPALICQLQTVLSSC
jgi:hypothetical protein